MLVVKMHSGKQGMDISIVDKIMWQRYIHARIMYKILIQKQNITSGV